MDLFPEETLSLQNVAMKLTNALQVIGCNRIKGLYSAVTRNRQIPMKWATDAAFGLPSDVRDHDEHSLMHQRRWTCSV
jgi:hypothetical protein